MQSGFFSICKKARALDDNLCANLTPGNLTWVLLSEDLNALAIDYKIVIANFNEAMEAAVCRVVAEEVCIRRGIGDIVDADDLDVAGMSLQNSLEALAANSTESVDADASCHS